MRLSKWLLALMLCLIIPLSGCTPKEAKVTVPSPEVTIDEAMKINLKILDLTKMTTGDTDEALGYHFENIEGAKIIEYRYPNKPIVIKIAKFKNLPSAKEFWENWTNFLKQEYQLSNQNESEQGKNFWEFKTLDSQVLAWEETLWFVYIEVPIEFKNSAELSHKVKQIISLHFESLK